MTVPRRNKPGGHAKPPLFASGRVFLRAWVRNPLKMGAAVPSSRWLARSMVRSVDLKKPGTIVELGAGTGPVTHALLEAGVPASRLLVVERDARLHHLLCSHFPGVDVQRGDAANLVELLRHRQVHKVCAVISSLPLLSMPKALAAAIVEQMFTVAGEGGVVVQFTYGPTSPINKRLLRRFDATAKRTGLVLRNVPPATIWRYVRHPRH